VPWSPSITDNQAIAGNGGSANVVATGANGTNGSADGGGIYSLRGRKWRKPAPCRDGSYHFKPCEVYTLKTNDWQRRFPRSKPAGRLEFEARFG
jgi:hypothetical protein